MSKLYTARAAIQLPTISGSPPDPSLLPLTMYYSHLFLTSIYLSSQKRSKNDIPTCYEGQRTR